MADDDDVDMGLLFTIVHGHVSRRPKIKLRQRVDRRDSSGGETYPMMDSCQMEICVSFGVRSV